MKNTQLSQLENSQELPNFSGFELLDSKDDDFGYFLQSESSLQLDYNIPFQADLQMSESDQQFNFVEPKQVKLTDMTVNETMRFLSHENQSLQKIQNEITLKSFLDCSNNQLNKKYSVSDFISKTSSKRSEKQFEGVFQQAQIKGKYHKNTNVPKILVRIYLKHYSKYMRRKNSKSLEYSHMQIKEQLLNRQTNNHNISDLLQLLNAGSEEISDAGIHNRQTMTRIILETMKKEVILNNFVKKNRMSYMLALKIYALRCRSSTLTQRVQIM